MNNMNTQSTGATPATTSLFNKIVAVITALSLVFLQVPFSGWASKAMADATDAAQEQLASNAAIDVPLTFENAYITYAGQIIAPPATMVTIPGGAAMEFTAEADGGYQLESVVATINGTEVALSPDGNGAYKLTAADVATTSNITVRGITAPTVEEAVTVEGPAAQSGPASAEPTTESASAASPAANDRAEFVYSDDDVTVRATLSQVDAIPANATFQVKPITMNSEGYNYGVYMSALNEAAAEGVVYNDDNTLLYDISFMVPKTDDAGNAIAGQYVEYEPQAGTVSITITFNNAQLANQLDATQASDVEIVHLPLSTAVRNTVDSTEDATNIYVKDVAVESVQNPSASVAAEQVSFTVSSLSPIAVSTAASGTNLTAGSSTALRGSGAQTSTNLADFLTNAVINAPTNSDGEYVVAPNEQYTVSLTFAENSGLQFPNDGSTMTYQLPSGLDIMNGSEGSLTIKINDGGTYVSVPDNTFRIQNGTLYFNFNTSDPNFATLAASNNAKFNMAFQASFTQGASSVLFADGVSRNIAVDTSTNVTASKSSNVYRSDKKVAYTVTVRSDGASHNVVVTDTMNSDVLSLDPGSFQVSSSTGRSLSFSNGGRIEGDTFTYAIGDMANGEVITIVYNADIDVSKIPNNNHQYISVVNNDVVVTSDDDPTPGDAHQSTSINYTPSVDKSGPTVVTDNGDHKTLEWQIVANEKMIVSMAGDTITDRIRSASVNYMKYSGTGIKVEVYNGKKLVETRDVPWSQLNKTDTTWTYTVPQSDSGKAYKYVITYTTDIDISSGTGMVAAKNEVTTGGGKSDTAGDEYMPSGGEVKVSKSVVQTDVANKEITWKVSFNVPEDGLSEACVRDYIPNKWLNGVHLYEKLIDGSVTVTGLKGDESYKVKTDNLSKADDPYFKIQFYTDKKQNTHGLLGGGERTITVTFKTPIDDRWLAAVPSNSWYQEHDNTVKLTANSDVKTATATARVAGPTIKKTVENAGTRKVNGVDLPIYKFTLLIDGITSDDNTIIDTFDT